MKTNYKLQFTKDSKVQKFFLNGDTWVLTNKFNDNKVYKVKVFSEQVTNQGEYIYFKMPNDKECYYCVCSKDLERIRVE